jgi:HSP20 family molecular chaperone IbpA
LPTIFEDAAVESGDMLVITTAVSASAPAELSISVADHAVVITGLDGFRHEVAFPCEADTANLHAVLYDGILELRVPRL